MQQGLLCLVFVGLFVLPGRMLANQPIDGYSPGIPLPIRVPGTPAWTQGVDIGKYVQSFDDLSGIPLSFAEVQQQRFTPFRPKAFRLATPSPVSTIVTWLRFRVQNTSTTQPTDLLLNVGRQGQIDLFSERGQLLQRTGTYQMPYNVRQWQPLRLQVLPVKTTLYLVKVTNLVRVIEPVQAVLHTPVSLKVWFAENAYLTRWLFLGLIAVGSGLLVMSLFALSQYYFNRDLVFLYYAIFCFTAFFFIVWNMNFRMGLGLPLQMHSTSRNFTFIIAFFYTLFIARFIELRAHFPKTWLFLRFMLVIFIAQELFVTYEYINGLQFRANWPYLRQDFTFLLAGIVMFVTLVRSKSPFRHYLIAGVSCLWLISYGNMFIDKRFDGGDPALLVFINYIPFFFGLGMLCENFFFLLALAYRNRLVEIEKNQIQSQYTTQLEAQLTKRTAEIEAKNQLLEQQHIQHLKTEFDQRLADTELTALRSQMNPHFIFNCLNSVKLYTLQNDTDRAADYLTKFARLIRLVLENSRTDRVTLHNELEALQLYSDLEAMRFKEKVQVHIRIDPDIDLHFVTIPPLLLQPYVENAIWHGLMHKPEGGTVTVDITQPTDPCLHVEITDDGIGRARAAELKSKSAGNHKSFGMQVTADRIRMINSLYNTQTEAHILDLVAPNGDPLGTKIVLDIPV